MKKFYRINEEKMNVLATYMDDEVREAMHFRFALCSNEEFTIRVRSRGGITKETIEEVLNIHFEELENTFMFIDTIKDLMHYNNVINSIKIEFPARELCTEPSEKGKEYRFYLNQYCECLNILKKEKPEMAVLSDLKEEFSEIDCYFKSGYCFYTWKNVIL